MRSGADLSLPARIGGAELTPFGTVDARREGGAGQTGDGIEVAGGLRAVLGFVRLDARAPDDLRKLFLSCELLEPVVPCVTVQCRFRLYQ